MDKHAKRHLRRAVEHFGTATNLARAIGKYQQYVSWLLNGAQSVPPEIAIDIETATAGIVTKSDLRPDLWPPAIDGARGPSAGSSERAA